MGCHARVPRHATASLAVESPQQDRGPGRPQHSRTPSTSPLQGFAQEAHPNEQDSHRWTPAASHHFESVPLLHTRLVHATERPARQPTRLEHGASRHSAPHRTASAMARTRRTCHGRSFPRSRGRCALVSGAPLPQSRLAGSPRGDTPSSPPHLGRRTVLGLSQSLSYSSVILDNELLAALLPMQPCLSCHALSCLTPRDSPVVA